MSDLPKIKDDYPTPKKLPDGTVEWTLNGVIHRDYGPAIEYFDGSKEWYKNGKPHRVGFPAVEGADGERFWYLNGNIHREDGPAVTHADGSQEWWLCGEKMPMEEHPHNVKEILLKEMVNNDKESVSIVKPKSPSI